MKVLHTSDWHIGHQFHNRRRDADFAAFLDWLVKLAAERAVDVLIVSGDVFDTSAPGNTAVRLYYDFLKNMQATTCREIIITGGNHDSPSFLNAPRELLRSAFGIHIFGSASEDPADEVVPVYDAEGRLSLIVGAVPYLRDADLATMTFGEDWAEREAKRREGFRRHYRAVADAAEKLRAGQEVPVILTGHFFLAGGHLGENDGVREYVGGIASVDPSLLPPEPDYYALGHLHQAQCAGSDRIRYSGSPLKMSFSDSEERMLYELEFTGRRLQISEIRIPQFTAIRNLHGSWEKIEPELEEVAASEREICCGVTVTDLSGAELMNRIESVFKGRMRNYPLVIRSEAVEPGVPANSTERNVAVMTASEIFDLLLERIQIGGEDAEELRKLYRETVVSVTEKD